MPIYEYQCDVCGVFTAMRKMSESGEPACCDVCGHESPRVISAPRLAVMGRTQRELHERNEKSAHEPKISKRSSCGCTGSHTCNSSNKFNHETGKAAMQMQTKKTARPWMLGH